MLLCVDKFRQKEEERLFVLTHAHTDHSRIAQKFPFPIYCSPITCNLMKLSHPHVTFVPTLVLNTWCVIHKNVFLYVFDSGHCIGGIGFYCPQQSYLHFGEGRPSQDTIQMLLYTIELFPSSSKLKAECDSLFFRDFEFIDTIPTQKDTQHMIRDIILSQKAQNVLIRICVSHFGTLSFLPLEFGYHWIGSLQKSIAGHMCYEAFEQLHLKRGDIAVLRTHEEEQLPEEKNYITIILSARWFLIAKQQEPTLDLYVPQWRDENTVRVFACCHASPSELARFFGGFCAS